MPVTYKILDVNDDDHMTVEWSNGKTSVYAIPKVGYDDGTATADSGFLEGDAFDDWMAERAIMEDIDGTVDRVARRATFVASKQNNTVNITDKINSKRVARQS